jgi:hypothetical protein
MSNKQCVENLDNRTPSGLLGNFEVHKVTNVGHQVDCKLQRGGSDTHLVVLELENHSPNPWAVKFEVEINNGNVRFANSRGSQYGETILLGPAFRWPKHWDFREQIEATTSKKFQSDDIELRLECWKLAMSGSPRVKETISVDVN